MPADDRPQQDQRDRLTIQDVTGPFFATASFAWIQARAECMARSGPQASGLPTRIASQKPATSNRVADGRSAEALMLRDVEVDGAFAGRLSDASSAGPPVFGVSSIFVARRFSASPSSKSR